MIYVLATRNDEYDYPEVAWIFLCEEKAIKKAKQYKYNNGISIQYHYLLSDVDLDPLYMRDPLWLGKCEEGGDIQYYKAFTNDYTMKWRDKKPEAMKNFTRF